MFKTLTVLGGKFSANLPSVELATAHTDLSVFYNFALLRYTSDSPAVTHSPQRGSGLAPLGDPSQLCVAAQAPFKKRRVATDRHFTHRDLTD